MHCAYNFSTQYLDTMLRLRVADVSSIRFLEWLSVMHTDKTGDYMVLIVASTSTLSAWRIAHCNNNAAAELLTYTMIAAGEISSLCCDQDIVLVGLSTGHASEYRLTTEFKPLWDCQFFLSAIDAIKVSTQHGVTVISSCGFAILFNSSADPRVVPLHTQMLHAAPVSGIGFGRDTLGDRDLLVTSSLDATLAVWSLVDLHTGAYAAERVSSHVKSNVIMGLTLDSSGLQLTRVDVVPADLSNSSEVQMNNNLKHPHCRLYVQPFTSVITKGPVNLETVLASLHDYTESVPLREHSLLPLVLMIGDCMLTIKYGADLPPPFADAPAEQDTKRGIINVYRAILKREGPAIPQRLELILDKIFTTYQDHLLTGTTGILK